MSRRSLILPAFLACAATISLVGFGSADPAPDTPGNSGNQNPHGAPPGQGGPVPGNSGAQNPHGTPPGQRISDPAPAASGNPPPSTAPSGPSGQPVPSAGGTTPSPSGGPAARPVLPARLTTREAATPHDTARIQALLGSVMQLKGWERGWEEMIERHTEVVLEVASELTEDETVTRWNTRVARSGLRRRTERTATMTECWISDPPTSWYRNGTSPWQAVTSSLNAGTRWPADLLPHFAFAMWGAIPRSLGRDSQGDVEVFLDANYGETIRWTAGSLDRTIRQMASFDATGATNWTESRRFSTVGGQLVMVSRERVEVRPVRRVMRERLAWQIGPGTVPENWLMPLP